MTKDCGTPEDGGESRESVTKEAINNIVRIATHPEFRNLMREIAERPDDDRVAFAKLRATPSEFARRGIPTPDGTRITLRYFENPSAATITQVKLADEVFSGVEKPGGSSGEVVCVSHGETVGGVTKCCTVGEVITTPPPKPQE